MKDSKLNEIVKNLLDGVSGLSKSETVIGDPQTAGDAVIIPVHRLKIAFGAGSASAGAQGSKVGGNTGAEGAGGAVELDPIGAIAVGKDGRPRLLTVDADAASAWSELVREVPEILGKIAKGLGQRLSQELEARDAGGTGVLGGKPDRALPDSASPQSEPPNRGPAEGDGVGG